jgi:hypothetical protein
MDTYYGCLYTYDDTYEWPIQAGDYNEALNIFIKTFVKPLECYEVEIEIGIKNNRGIDLCTAGYHTRDKKIISLETYNSRIDQD